MMRDIHLHLYPRETKGIKREKNCIVNSGNLNLGVVNLSIVNCFIV